jgi:2-oxoglutarate/2-oxoacid ferredoxin oxidoreductase subunit alpha
MIDPYIRDRLDYIKRRIAMDINFMIGGEAGQGVQSVGFLLAKAVTRGGYHIFADQDYESRVRGGHNFYRIRVKDTPVHAIGNSIDILITLDKESISLHMKEVRDGGIIVYDSTVKVAAGGKARYIGIPLNKLAEEKAGNKIAANTVALGAVLSLTGLDFDILAEVLREHFGNNETGESNVKAARAGYDYTSTNSGTYNITTLDNMPAANRMLLNGNEAIALGALAAGCKFIAAYPMTPASSIMEYMATKSNDLNVVVIQPEDEISAINMVVGASYAGARAMTATSGGGFCLMVEGIGLAGITETPAVIVDAQRPGPAIGLPTRTEQSDLLFAINCSHGEFPRVVLAPGTVEEAFWLTVKAFNLADKYQLPVIILTDQHLASSYATTGKFDLSKVTIDRGTLVTGNVKDTYKRHALTENGISPRAFPLQKNLLVVTDSDEHDEEGHPIESAEIRTQMVQKRMKKLELLKQQDLAQPEPYPGGKGDTLLVGWGSTHGAIREAVDILNSKETGTGHLHISELWPFPAEAVDKALSAYKKSYVIENNATGQLARLIQEQTGKKVSGTILKYDGRPFEPANIVEDISRKGGH